MMMSVGVGLLHPLLCFGLCLLGNWIQTAHLIWPTLRAITALICFAGPALLILATFWTFKALTKPETLRQGVLSLPMLLIAGVIQSLVSASVLTFFYGQ